MKFAARQAMFAMAVESDAEPPEVLLKTIRIAWGGVQGIREKLVDIDPDTEPKAFGMWQSILGEWTDRAAKYAKMALDAGVEERKVRVAEAEGALLAEVIKAILGDLGLTREQQALAGPAVRRHLLALSA